VNYDEYGTTLLRPLAGEPAGPPRIDLPRAMREGRRLRRRRWGSGIAALLATLAAVLVGSNLLLAPAAPAPTPTPKPTLPPDPVVPAACTVSPLPDGGHRSVAVTGGDSTGRWHVGTATPNAGDKGPMLIWHDGKLVAQIAPPNGDARLHDINSSGVAVGSNNSDWDTYPFVYRNGKIERLKGGRGVASAINDAGEIVGTIGVNNRHPVRWKTADAEPETLPMPPGATIQFVLDVAPDGTISGMYLSDTFVWSPDGKVRKLTPPTPDGIFRPGSESFGFGWLYGVSLQAGVYRYEPHTGTWQHLTDAGHKAQFPGTGSGDAQVSGKDELSVFVGRQVLRLGRNPIKDQPGNYSFEITTISADGHVVAAFANSLHENPAAQPDRSFIWRCR